MKSGDLLRGKYRLEHEIGRGAMGEVWSAFDHTSNRRVALKSILPQAKEQLTKDLRQRLLREARACGKLSHPHIVQIFEVGETPEGEPFIILELLTGKTLGERLKEKRRIEPAMAARIAAEVASGLAVAHAAQVIHRDLKPANIFLHREEGMSEDMFVSKILDFGVCKNLDSVDSVATQTGIAVGSPAYMSPEQVGMRKDIDHRTDLWSLGIVLFEMLTGARPFSGSVHEVVRQILLAPVPPPSSKVRDVPQELDAIVARCTAGKREARYASADELANELFALARTLRPMTRKPTFTGAGAAPSMYQSSSMERPAVSVPTSGPAPSPTATPQGAFVSPPQEVDESELAATLPLQGRMLMAMRPSAPQPTPRTSAPTGTEIIQPNETLASPASAWNRDEMQRALAAHRRSNTSNPELAVPDPAATGGTQGVTDSQMQTMPSALDPVGTTSSAGALSQRTTGNPAPPTPLGMMDPVSATGRRRKHKNVLMWLTGGGVVVAVGLVIGIIAIATGKVGELDATAVANEASSAGNQVAAAPTVTEATAPATAPVVTSPPAPPTAAPTAMPAPSEVAAPSVNAPPPPAPSPTLAVQAPAKPTNQASPPKPTNQGASSNPIIFDVSPKPTAQTPPPAPKCTGKGLLIKCKK